MAAHTCTWLVLSVLLIYATLVGGRSFERQTTSIADGDTRCYDNVTNCQDYIDHDSTICSSDSPFYGLTTKNCRASCNMCQVLEPPSQTS